HPPPPPPFPTRRSSDLPSHAVRRWSFTQVRFKPLKVLHLYVGQGRAGLAGLLANPIVFRTERQPSAVSIGDNGGIVNIYLHHRGDRKSTRLNSSHRTIS